MKHFYIILFFCCFGLTYAQNEAENWYFGSFAGVNFQTGSPEVLLQSGIFTNEGSATISDADGNLLFYSNGNKVYNKNHEVMPNGQDLFGHWSSTQSALIVPKPNSNNIYYIFTVDEPNSFNADFYPEPNPDPLHIIFWDELSDSDDGLNNGLNYSIVDMTMDSGNGDIISKNNHLITYNPDNIEEIKYKNSEKLTGVYNAEADYFWVTTHFIDEFYSFKVDENGVDINPVISASPEIPLSGYTFNGIGYMKFSPDGTKLGMANYSNGTTQEQSNGNGYLFDFDINTGIVSNDVLFEIEGYPYGLEFSPNSKMLYFSVKGIETFTAQIIQFDTETLAAHVLTNFTNDEGALQLGIDGKIYGVKEAQQWLFVINNPNEAGDAMDIVNAGAYYGDGTPGGITNKGRYGLPNFIQSYFDQAIASEYHCLGSQTEFRLSNVGNVQEVTWDFGDPASGAANTSTELLPTHIFSNAGAFEVKATVTTESGSIIEVLSTIDIYTVPIAHTLGNIYACENEPETGLSSSFDTSTIESEVISGQLNTIVFYFDSSGNQLSTPLPNPLSNSEIGIETITIRVANVNNTNCFSETNFDLIVTDKPIANSIEDLVECDDDVDGFAVFDSSNLESLVLGNQTGMEVFFYDGNNNPLPSPLPSTLSNSIPNLELLTAHVINPNGDCYSEIEFNLVVNPIPELNDEYEIVGCDEDNDGISEYFDTSTIEEVILGNQNQMNIVYYDSNDDEITLPLPNPYTNSVPYEEFWRARVINSLTGCYKDTQIRFVTATQPQINQPMDLFSCDEGDGYSSFDLSFLEGDIIGSQSGLEISYFDDNGNPLPIPLPSNFTNATPYNQTINVRVENSSNATCYVETSFELFVIELPIIELEENYQICDAEPSLYLSTNPNFYSWEWTFEDGSIISNSFDANLINEGDYTLLLSKLENGVICQNSFTFNLVRSEAPVIDTVNYTELSQNNTIEVIAQGDGDYEYSIDGINYQDSNFFNNIEGGLYTVYVRDKNGCGEDFIEVVILDIPKFFTPNNDGYNDTWLIKGIWQYPSAIGYIYDRYGKVLETINLNGFEWDGTYNGKQMPSSDYWFTIDLKDGRQIKGHFTLKR